MKTSNNISKYVGCNISAEVKVTLKVLYVPTNLLDWPTKTNNKYYMKNTDGIYGDIIEEEMDQYK